MITYAFIAGFYEACGCMTLKDSVQVAFNDTRPDTLLAIYKTLRIGCVRYYEPTKTQSRAMYVYTISKKSELKTFFEAIQPHVCLKQQEVALCIAYLQKLIALKGNKGKKALREEFATKLVECRKITSFDLVAEEDKKLIKTKIPKTPKQT
jgi:hypothetical protein